MAVSSLANNYYRILGTEMQADGSAVFRIALLPRFTGRYHLNPARAELMYFPTFHGREGMKQVGVAE